MKIAYMLQVLQQLPRTWRLLLLSFGSAVSIWQLGKPGGLIAADVVSGQWQRPKADSQAESGAAGTASAVDLPAPEPLHIAALQSCQERAEQIIQSWRYVPNHTCSGIRSRWGPAVRRN